MTAGKSSIFAIINNLFIINFYALLVYFYAFSGIYAFVVNFVIFCQKLSSFCNRAEPTRLPGCACQRAAAV